MSKIVKNEQPFYGHLIQDNLGDPVLLQRRDLLEQPLDFSEPDVLPAIQTTVSKHYRKTQWFGHLLFCRHNISTQCLIEVCRSAVFEIS